MTRDDIKQLLDDIKNTQENEIEEALGDDGEEVKKLYGKIVSNVVETERNMVFDDRRWIDWKYNQREYYRRSSRARIVFEKLLFELGYLVDESTEKGNETNEPKTNNLLLAEGVDSQRWEQEMKNDVRKIPFFFPHSPRKTSISLTGQEFSLYAILQKRWMVFEWGEGYEETTNEISDEEKRNKKLHPYLQTYDKIYMNPTAMLVHTLPISYNLSGGGEENKRGVESD